MTSQSTLAPEEDEDTIELELTAEEMLGLSRAANAAQASTSGSAPALISAKPVAQVAKKKRFRLLPVTLAAALVGIVAAIAWRPSPPHRVIQRAPPTPVARSTPPPAPHPVVVVEQSGPPVRVKNPFDAREVFEFPAGTTRAEARRRVAALLMQRAIDRRGPGAEAEDKRRVSNN